VSGGHPDAVIADLGRRWELEQIALRPWPAASSIQGMMTALFDIVDKHKIDPAQVKTLRIALSQPVFDLHGNFARYKAKFEALLSAHYVAAAILHDRELTLAQFESARYDDPKLRRFAERVEVRVEPDLRGVAAIVDLDMADGQSFSGRCDHPLGGPENKLSRAQVEAKFRTYAAERLSPQSENVIGAVVRLEHQASVGALMDMLRATPQSVAAAPAAVAARARA
jgi:2-methylcitrate dehydratase PrpD